MVVADHVAEPRPVAAGLGHAPGREHVAAEARRVEHAGEALGRLHVVLHEDGHHLGGVPRQEPLHLPEHVHRRLLSQGGKNSRSVSQTELCVCVETNTVSGRRLGGGGRAYKGGEVLADAAVGVAEPDVVAEVVHVQHQPPHAVLHHRQRIKVRPNLCADLLCSLVATESSLRPCLVPNFF